MDVGIEAIIKDLVKDLASAVLKKTVSVGTKQYDKALVTLNLCFSKYLQRSFSRYSKIKTLLYRDRPVDLKAHYVSTDFQINGEDIDGIEILNHFFECKKNVVVGTAGSGKSVLLRRTFLELIDNQRGIVPIIIELRLLETPDTDFSIFDFIHKTLADLEEDFSKEQLHFALKEGKLALFLDGFDEIDFDKKNQYEREILELSNKYDESVIVVSSRPDDCFSSWVEFHIAYTRPLNQSQAVDLISKIEYDIDVKNKFVEELQTGLYKKHNDFLSNPLLLTMMLLTYEQLAEIPEKVHIFYEQAFDTLYHKHDALKAMYKRKSYTGLPIDDFKRIFSAFCIFTYTERKMSFTYRELISYLEKAIDVESYEVKPRDFFNDLIKSVCILQKDGATYTFSHRSFQEYFSAYYISASKTIDTGRLLDILAKESYRDNVISLLFELNKEQIETTWIIPRLCSILESTTDNIEKEAYFEYLSSFYLEMTFRGEGIGFMLDRDNLHSAVFDCLPRLYKTEFDVYEENRLSDQENERIASFDKNLFIENTAYKGLESEYLLSELVKTPLPRPWLNKTWIPQHCNKRHQLTHQLYNGLRAKYKKKEESIASLIFNKS